MTESYSHFRNLTSHRSIEVAKILFCFSLQS